jgi:hypothetical protein
MLYIIFSSGICFSGVCNLFGCCKSNDINKYQKMYIVDSNGLLKPINNVEELSEEQTGDMSPHNYKGFDRFPPPYPFHEMILNSQPISYNRRVHPASYEKKDFEAYENEPMQYEVTTKQIRDIEAFVKNIILILNGWVNVKAEEPSYEESSVKHITKMILTGNKAEVSSIMLDLFRDFNIDQVICRNAFSVNKDQKDVKHKVATALSVLQGHGPRGTGYLENDLRHGLVKMILSNVVE